MEVSSEGEMLLESGFDTLEELPSKDCKECGKMVMRHMGEDTWVLVMKLSKNDFCYSSTRWTDGKAHNPDKMMDTTFPNHAEYDAKHIAFHRLKHVDSILLQTRRPATFHKSPRIDFDSKGTPQSLMTKNSHKLSKYPDWNTWRHAFGSDRNRAPAFFRAGSIVADPKPICRNSNLHISGCGKPCMFCMMAGDGHGCPTSGAHNDISSGLGLNAAFCGGGDANTCSASGHWSGHNRVLVWARYSAYKSTTTTTTTPKCGSGICCGKFGGLGPWRCDGVKPDACNDTYVELQPEEYIQCGTVNGVCLAAGDTCKGIAATTVTETVYTHGDMEGVSTSGGHSSLWGRPFENVRSGNPNEKSWATWVELPELSSGGEITVVYQYNAGYGCKGTRGGTTFDVFVGQTKLTEEPQGPFEDYPYDYCHGTGCPLCYSPLQTLVMTAPPGTKGPLVTEFVSRNRNMHLKVEEVRVTTPIL
eukprot:CAMPEP_0181487278 /NCGR_PEP_ID=MMETSP1110-20121109/47719_1 /TAXON_ID=174948 /ORGANISM="Symbiodinium sp., Strain CCMP421" /LENGTH=472 /DNA_ID=CAMNT_0023613745 /DNA_START=59 /DNA_END=1477 /DNA_ORIENTATION=-